MIRIGGARVQDLSGIGPYRPGSLKRQVLDTLFNSGHTYDYSSVKELQFELDLREKIVRAAERLNSTRFGFEVFKNSRCNQNYWKRTPEGGFLVRSDVSPFMAIRDFYANSHLYGTECSTAIVIVFYLALTEILPEGLFNRLFSDIYLMNWKYLDKDLGMRSYENLPDYLPGDCRYVKNPDVNPETMEWQGENTIQLLNGYHWGHGVGIRTIPSIISVLNRHRKPGARRSAYLMDLAIRPGYKYLYRAFSQFQDV
ncbi:MAG: protein-glutamine gamma-glutamyltransferase [Clostridiaceae bacterium]|nr:protein-glutamine gamma-glutamyltransferase [Clostridiaceae bacterium]